MVRDVFSLEGNIGVESKRIRRTPRENALGRWTSKPKDPKARRSLTCSRNKKMMASLPETL